MVRVRAHRRSGGKVKVKSYTRSKRTVDGLKFKAGDKVKSKSSKKQSQGLRGMARGKSRVDAQWRWLEGTGMQDIVYESDDKLITYGHYSTDSEMPFTTRKGYVLIQQKGDKKPFDVVNELTFKSREEAKLYAFEYMNKRFNQKNNELDFPDKRDLAGGNPVEFKVIVPSTKDFSKALSKREFEERISETAVFLTGLFGGSTVTEGRGTYEFQGEVISEDVAVLTVNAKKKDYLKYDVVLEDWLKAKKKAWGQDSMGFEYQGKLIFV